jgi:hypothetical protein
MSRSPPSHWQAPGLSSSNADDGAEVGGGGPARHTIVRLANVAGRGFGRYLQLSSTKPENNWSVMLSGHRPYGAKEARAVEVASRPADQHAIDVRCRKGHSGHPLKSSRRPAFPVLVVSSRLHGEEPGRKHA